MQELWKVKEIKDLRMPLRRLGQIFTAILTFDTPKNLMILKAYIH
jgi:hypothetical protein